MSNLNQEASVLSDDVFAGARDWEVSRTLLMERSERRAWTITFIAVGLVLVSWVAIVLMLPLKETTPFVIRVDSSTGVPDIVTVMHDQKIGYEDVMDKYWVTQYVRARERYDWYTLQADYTQVGLLSSPPVGAEYVKLFQGDAALDKKMGNTFKAVVDVVSAVPNGRGSATVRFVKRIKRVADDGPGDPQWWVATVSYEYRNPSVMKESLRRENPFGFQVLSYRVDPEIVGGGK